MTTWMGDECAAEGLGELVVTACLPQDTASPARPPPASAKESYLKDWDTTVCLRPEARRDTGVAEAEADQPIRSAMVERRSSALIAVPLTWGGETGGETYY